LSPQGHISAKAKSVYVLCLHGYNNWLEYQYVCLSLQISCISFKHSEFIWRSFSLYSNKLHSTWGFKLSGQPKGCWAPGLRPQAQHSWTHMWWLQRYFVASPQGKNLRLNLACRRNTKRPVWNTFALLLCLRIQKTIHSRRVSTLSFHCVQGDWCHSNKLTSC